MRGRRRYLLGAGLGLGLAAVIAAVAVLEGDVTEEFADATAFVKEAVARFGAPGALGLLYIEESGVPLPLPGDAYVIYLGSLATGSALRLLAAWVAIIAVVVAGSTNLYLISRRWGHRLLEHRLAHFFHLDQGRLDRAERWLRRWGAPAIIFGRHVPGFRIPVTVLSGVFEIPYRVFAPSVAVSTAIWAAVWLLLGERYGHAAINLFRGHPTVYLAAVGGVAVIVAALTARAWLRAERPSPAGPSGTSVGGDRPSL